MSRSRASTSYSRIPGRARAIAPSWASRVMRAAARIVSTSPGRLAQAHLVEDRARIDDLGRREDAAARARADPVDGGEEPLVEAAIVADAVVDAAAVLQEIRQLLLEIADDEGLVGSEVLPAPSTPARGPSQTSRSRSRGRTKKVVLRSFASSTTTLSGSSNPVM